MAMKVILAIILFTYISLLFSRVILWVECVWVEVNENPLENITQVNSISTKIIIILANFVGISQSRERKKMEGNSTKMHARMIMYNTKTHQQQTPPKPVPHEHFLRMYVFVFLLRISSRRAVVNFKSSVSCPFTFFLGNSLLLSHPGWCFCHSQLVMLGWMSFMLEMGKLNWCTLRKMFKCENEEPGLKIRTFNVTFSIFKNAVT